MTDDFEVLKLLLDGSNQIILVNDVETFSMIYANATAKAYAGRTNEPYEGRKCYEYIMKMDHPCPFCPLFKRRNEDEFESEADRGNEVFAFKTKFINWHGRKVFIEYAWDITNIRRSENIYRTELEAIINSSEKAHGIFHIDLDENKVLSIRGTVSPINKEAKTHYDQLLKYISSYIPSESQKTQFLNTFSVNNLHNAYSNGKMSAAIDVMSNYNDEDVHETSVIARLLTNPKTSHLECVIISKMDEEHALNREIKLTNKLNEALACEYGTIFMLNLHNGTMRIRKMADTQNAKKLNLPEVLPFDSFFKQYAENFIVEEDVEDVLKTINVENLRRRVDNGDFNINIRYKVKPNNIGEEYFEAIVLPVTTEDHYHMVVGVKCIDKLIAREEADKQILRESRAQAEAASKAKTSFLFNMSHDIRTPMNAIMGFTNLLEKHQDDKERRRDYLKKISDSSRILLSIINNVLEMARIEKGTIELDESAWSSQQFNDSIFTVFGDMMKNKNIEFTRELNVQHNYVMCDPIKMREVFINVISNAYKYTPEGGKIHLKLDELPSDREGYAIYQTTLTDNGRGMSKEFLPHIFEEFTREKNTTHGKVEGTGLGMPIVKRLIEIMGGTIKVESELGVGTTVIITIPHKITDKSNLVNHFGVELDPKIIQGKRVLLAEDNELNAEIAIEILNEAGFLVEHANDGQQCVNMLEQAEAGYYDLILMDIQMPNMNGYETARSIRVLDDKFKASIPIIAMTANAFEEDKREAMLSGMNSHIAKPIDVTELIKAIANNLGA